VSLKSSRHLLLAILFSLFAAIFFRLNQQSFLQSTNQPKIFNSNASRICIEVLNNTTACAFDRYPAAGASFHFQLQHRTSLQSDSV